MASAWTAAHVAGIAAAPRPAVARFAAAAVPRPVAGHDLWDFWPVQTATGAVADIGGGSLWFALAAPTEGHPDLRHERARLRLLALQGGTWLDRGWALPDGFAPGSRDWSGSAVLHDDGALALYFTAAGSRGEARTSYRQRLFETHARIADGLPNGWTPSIESVASDGRDYVVADQAEGSVGTIKAFRDPAWFRDPAGGPDRILFAASLAGSTSAFNGAIGVAERSGDGWTLRPPLVHADGLNNELERPHIVVRDGRYYLLWSTQRSCLRTRHRRAHGAVRHGRGALRRPVPAAQRHRPRRRQSRRRPRPGL